VAFSAVISLAGLGWLPEQWAWTIEGSFDSYYTGVIGNVVTFLVGFVLARLLPERPRDLTNLTVWTLDSSPLDAIPSDAEVA
jgi:hypothetical protein